MNMQDQTRKEMTEIQVELETALKDMMVEVGAKLKPAERQEVETEFQLLNELLVRLKSGKIYVALFGKTSVGKSAITNALMEEDVATVGVQHDLTTEATPYSYHPWEIVDVPGFMGDEINEKVAIDEAKKAHCLIFVIDGEPLKPELDLFSLIKSEMPDTPRIVFVNKWDRVVSAMPKRDRDTVKSMIEQKMSKYVKSPDDIVFGSAELFDPQQDKMVRQELPNLLERMYADAGTFGMVMNVIDPARRAEQLGSKMRDKILDVRIGLARRVVSCFGAASVAGGFVPFSHVIAAPAILGAMVYTIMHIMGHKGTKGDAWKIAVEVLKASGAELIAEFAAITFIDGVLTTGLAFATGGFSIIFGGAVVASLTGMSYYKLRRTVILGEVTIAYIKNGCTWGGEERHVVIQDCKERALKHYMTLRKQES